MYAYCNNNPVAYVDHNGELSWMPVLFIALCGLGGGILGYYSDVELGASLKDDTTLFPESEHSITDEEKQEDHECPYCKKDLTKGQRIKNAAIGAGIGLAVGGIICSIGGAVYVLSNGVGKTIGIINMTGKELWAFGTVVYNGVVLFLAPLIGLELEPIEPGEQYQVSYPTR
jgi:hypothetical protein